MHPTMILERKILPQAQEQARKKIDDCQHDEWMLNSIADIVPGVLAL